MSIHNVGMLFGWGVACLSSLLGCAMMCTETDDLGERAKGLGFILGPISAMLALEHALRYFTLLN